MSPESAAAPFQGLNLPTGGDSSDVGDADPALSAALHRHDGGAGTPYDAVAALSTSRLIVPVIAVLDEREIGADGLVRDKDSHMATVLLLAPDGRRGLLAFTSVETLQRWNAQARPVPAPGRQVAATALAEGADALLIDIAGPHAFVLDGAALRAVVSGRRWVPPYEDHEVRAAIASVMGEVGHAVREGSEDGVDVVVVLDRAGSPDEVRVLAQALAADEVLRDRCGLGVAIAAAAQPRLSG